MADEIDFAKFPITKLPPGKAFGADDLTRWSHNRAVGVSGSGSSNTRGVTLKCPQCKSTSEVMVSRYSRGNKFKKFKLHCHHCGKAGMAKIVNPNRKNP